MVSGKELNITKKEMKEVLSVSVSIMLGNLTFPRFCIYWGSTTRVLLIPDKINLKHFFKLHSNLHVVSQCNPAPNNNDLF